MKTQFKTTGKIAGCWDVIFTDNQHAYLQSEAINVGNEWPVVRGQELYSTFHFYLIDGKWTCHHPQYKSVYVQRAYKIYNPTEPTAGMVKALTEAVEAEFHDWAVQQTELLNEAQAKHINEQIEKVLGNINKLRKELADSEAEFTRLGLELHQVLSCAAQ
jgi:hypothetical protein